MSHTTTPAALADPELKRLHQRLERWELPHLREHCAQLALEIDGLRAELAASQERERMAVADAGYWHDRAVSLMETAAESGHTVGLTAGGQLGVMREFTAATDTDTAAALYSPTAARLQ